MERASAAELKDQEEMMKLWAKYRDKALKEKK
jgi:hypothetical protein